jgi:hypothetical protein
MIFHHDAAVWRGRRCGGLTRTIARGGLDWWRMWRGLWEAWHHTRELRQWTPVPRAAEALSGRSKRAIDTEQCLQ